MKNQLAIIAIALSALTAGTAQAAKRPYPSTFSTLTRTEVNADLAAWRAAGLADEWRSEETPDIYSIEYRRKIALYRHLLAQQRANRDGAGR